MALEDRVKALEDEVRILQDQIRSTLLEIQEQILAHYYPELRTKGSSLADRGSPPSGGRWKARDAQAGPGVRALSLAGAEPLPGASPAVPGAGSAASRDAAPRPPEDQAGAGQEAWLAPPLPPNLRAGPNGDAGWPTLVRLMAWASASVERIGQERTVRALDLCARGGQLDPGVKDALLQLIALGDERPPVERVSLKAVLDVLLELSQVLGGEVDVALAHSLVEETRVG